MLKLMFITTRFEFNCRCFRVQMLVRLADGNMQKAVEDIELDKVRPGLRAIRADGG